MVLFHYSPQIFAKCGMQEIMVLDKTSSERMEESCENSSQISQPVAPSD